jgi:hypothetical protein
MLALDRALSRLGRLVALRAFLAWEKAGALS